MGRELDRISRGLSTKIAIQIFGGKRRTEAPMQSTRLALDGGIILRQHIPIFIHWKQYKKNDSEITNYIGKIAISQYLFDLFNQSSLCPLHSQILMFMLLTGANSP
uniref:Uncharacterized protein n=1 Tax=Arundo donax TaxID=35708 RepID=A0A0A9GTF9_ARUDO